MDPIRRILTEYFLLNPKALDHKATTKDWSDLIHDLQFEETDADRRQAIAQSLGMYARPMAAEFLAGEILKRLGVVE